MQPGPPSLPARQRAVLKDVHSPFPGASSSRGTRPAYKCERGSRRPAAPAQYTIRPHASNSMQVKTVFLAALSLLASTALSASSSTTVTVSYDEAYDRGASSLATVACSDGTHGLLTKGYKTLGALPHFPNVGGAAVVGGWNSAQCGTCWQLTHGNRSVTVLAVDHAQSGWNVALGVMNALTGGKGRQLGRIEASAKQVDKSKCGL
ncbi:Cerato-platanin-domain-containing protein [Trametes cingulata]|nr:Cerato-platanin-domain-containing protein [Trametes cingulata]